MSATSNPAGPIMDRAPDVVRGINAARAAAGLPALQHAGYLYWCAWLYAEDMASYRRLRHDGRDGSDGGTRLHRLGYRWQAWGECIGRGYADPAAMVAGWIASPPHHRILMGEFSDAGVGIARAGDGELWYCLVVAVPQRSELTHTNEGLP